MRRVVGAGAVPEIPGFFRLRLFRVADEANRLVGYVLREVVAVLRLTGLVDIMVVLDQFGIPLIGLAADKTVEAVVAEAERPILSATSAMSKASTGTLWFLPTQNVLQPASRSTVAMVAMFAADGRIAGKADGRLRDSAKAVLVMVPASQEAGAGRRADRGRMPLRIGQAVFRQPVERRHLDAPAIGRHAAWPVSS